MLRTSAPLISALGIERKPSMNPYHFGGALLIANGLVIIGAWAVIISAAAEEHQTFAEAAIAVLTIAMSQSNPSYWIFVWLAALPWILFMLGAANLLNRARSVRRASLLFGTNIAVATISLVAGPRVPMIFMCVAILCGWRCVKEARDARSLPC